MKKIIMFLFILTMTIVLGFSVVDKKDTANYGIKYFGIWGRVTFGGNGVSSKTVIIKKEGVYVTQATTNGSGYYYCPDATLDGSGDYTATVSYCVGDDWYYGSNSGYYDGIEEEINVALDETIDGCISEE